MSDDDVSDIPKSTTAPSPTTASTSSDAGAVAMPEEELPSSLGEWRGLLPHLPKSPEEIFTA